MEDPEAERFCGAPKKKRISKSASDHKDSGSYRRRDAGDESGNSDPYDRDASLGRTGA